jgi:hypothetical protein
MLNLSSVRIVLTLVDMICDMSLLNMLNIVVRFRHDLYYGFNLEIA